MEALNSKKGKSVISTKDKIGMFANWVMNSGTIRAYDRWGLLNVSVELCWAT